MFAPRQLFQNLFIIGAVALFIAFAAAIFVFTLNGSAANYEGFGGLFGSDRNAQEQIADKPPEDQTMSKTTAGLIAVESEQGTLFRFTKDVEATSRA